MNESEISLKMKHTLLFLYSNVGFSLSQTVLFSPFSESHNWKCDTLSHGVEGQKWKKTFLGSDLVSGTQEPILTLKVGYIIYNLYDTYI